MQVRERRSVIERRSWLKRVYGESPEHYAERRLRQRGLCAICGKSLDDPGVKEVNDHDHETKENRGILCNHCNLMIGHAFENPRILRAGAEYMEKYKGAA